MGKIEENIVAKACPALDDSLEELELPRMPRDTALEVNGQRVSDIPIDGDYTIQPHDTYYSVARGVQAKGLYRDDAVGEIAKSLQDYNHGEALRLGATLDISNFRLHRITGVEMPARPGEQFTPLKGAKYGNTNYTLKGGEELFSVLRSYRDSIPNSTEHACLKGSPVLTLVAVENQLRREALVAEGAIEADGGLPKLTKGDTVSLTKIFNRDNLERVVKLLNNEGTQTSEQESTTASVPVTPTPKPAVKPEAKPEAKPVAKARDYLSNEEIHTTVAKVLERLKSQDGINVPPDIIEGLIETESSRNRLAISKVNARGLTQVRDIVLKERGIWSKGLQEKYGDAKSELLFVPEVSVEVGTRYLHKMHKRFGNWDDALASYNQGPTRWRSKLQTSDSPETEAHGHWYVKKVRARQEDVQGRHELLAQR